MFPRAVSLNKFFLLSLFLFVFNLLKAQDPHFSQYYASPVYLNPALTGTCDEGRFLFNYRTQWPSLPGEFVSYNVSYDHNFRNSGSNLGFLANLDRAGSAGFQSVNLSAIYAYTIKLNDDWALKAGLQLGYGTKSLNYLQLVFGDQLSNTGVTGNPTQDKGIENLSINFFDVGSGMVLYSNDFWLGFSAHHLNQPSYYFGSELSQIPMKLSVQGGYQFKIYGRYRRGGKDYAAKVHPSFYFSRQGDYMQLDLGLNVNIESVILGLWYRGIPIQPSSYGALAANVGFKYKLFTFLYGYDIPTNRFALATGGAHEITLGIDIDYGTISKFSRNRRKDVKFPSLTE